MEPFLIFVFLVLNFSISWFNAWTMGRFLADSKVIGGWPRFMTWFAATMSVVGFACYLVVLAILAGHFGWLGLQFVIFVVVLAVVSGILTTVAIVRTTAQNYSQEVLLSGTTKGIRGY